MYLNSKGKIIGGETPLPPIYIPQIGIELRFSYLVNVDQNRLHPCRDCWCSPSRDRLPLGRGSRPPPLPAYFGTNPGKDKVVLKNTILSVEKL